MYLSSPEFPLNYPHDVDCTYVLVSEAGYQTHIQFQTFHLEEPSINRCLDHVEILDHYDTPITICGSKDETQLSQMHFHSADNTLRLTFRSNAEVEHIGFSAKYYAFDERNCNQTMSITSNGSISSLPSGLAYFPNQHCRTRITVGQDRRVVFELVALEVETGESTDVCSRDYVQLWDVDAAAAARTWCGRLDKYTHTEKLYRSIRSEVAIVFHSNSLIEMHGFKLLFSAMDVCENNRLAEAEGQLFSPDYPSVYPNDVNCDKIIQTDKNKFIIELTFTLLNTETATGQAEMDTRCNLDYVEIHDGVRTHRRCGNWHGQEDKLYFRSIGRAMKVSFVSNNHVTNEGYAAEWHAVLDDFSGLPCPETWLDSNNLCFKIQTEPRTWQQANDMCNTDNNGHLATVSDERTQVFLENELTKGGYFIEDMVAYWIGANDLKFENDYTWSDGRPLDFQYWFPGWEQYNKSGSQPSDDGYSNEDCVEMRHTFYYPLKGFGKVDHAFWNDRNCDVINPFICQMYKEEDAQRSGYQTSVSCNSTIDLSEDNQQVFVTSPNYPHIYSNLLYCSIYISTHPGSRIEIEFLHFHLENSSSCDYDSVSMQNGVSNMNDGVKYCGDWRGREKLLTYVSSGSDVMLDLRSDHSFGYSGFRASIRLLDASVFCPDDTWFSSKYGCFKPVLTEQITYAQAEARCASMAGVLWEADGGRQQDFLERALVDQRPLRIWISKLHVSLADSATCPVLYIPSPGDGGDNSVRTLQCNSNLPFVCYTPANETVQEETQLLSPVEGRLSNPGFPSQDYQNNIRLSWRIVLPANHRAYIDLVILDIEDQADCLYDYVEFSEVLPSVPTPVQGRRFCGYARDYYVSETNTVNIIFVTDYSVTGKGFQLRWTGYDINTCSAMIANTSGGTIASFNHAMSYFNHLDCITRIVAPPGYRILLELDEFSLSNRSNNKCGDSLEIFLSSINSTILCPETTPETVKDIYLSASNEAVVRFRTDAEGESIGFKIRYTIVDPGHANLSRSVYTRHKPSGIVRSANFQLGFLSSITQDVTFHAPVGFNVVIRIRDVTDIPLPVNDESCDTVTMEIMDEFDPRDESVKYLKFCSPANLSALIGKQFVSYLHRIRLQLISGDIDMTSYPGFELVYSITPDEHYLNKSADIAGTFDECSQDTCMHTGSCTSTNADEYHCQCQSFYTGMVCQSTWCDVRHCLHGTCSLTSAYYTCRCDAAYFGEQCEMDSATCRNNVCSAHGGCQFGTSGPILCNCDDGYSGFQCDARIPVPPAKRSIGQKLLEEPIWIGLIAVLFVIFLSCIVCIVRRKYGKHFTCCNTPPKKGANTAETDIRLPYSTSSLATTPAMASGSITKRPQIQLDLVDENTVVSTPNVTQNNQAAAMKFFAAYNKHQPVVPALSPRPRRYVTGGRVVTTTVDIEAPAVIGGTLVLNREEALSRNNSEYRVLKPPSAAVLSEKGSESTDDEILEVHVHSHGEHSFEFDDELENFNTAGHASAIKSYKSDTDLVCMSGDGTTSMTRRDKMRIKSYSFGDNKDYPSIEIWSELSEGHSSSSADKDGNAETAAISHKPAHLELPLPSSIHRLSPNVFVETAPKFPMPFPPDANRKRSDFARKTKSFNNVLGDDLGAPLEIPALTRSDKTPRKLLPAHSSSTESDFHCYICQERRGSSVSLRSERYSDSSTPCLTTHSSYDSEMLPRSDRCEHHHHHHYHMSFDEDPVSHTNSQRKSSEIPNHRPRNSNSSHSDHNHRHHHSRRRERLASSRSLFRSYDSRDWYPDIEESDRPWSSSKVKHYPSNAAQRSLRKRSTYDDREMSRNKQRQRRVSLSKSVSHDQGVRSPRRSEHQGNRHRQSSEGPYTYSPRSREASESTYVHPLRPRRQRHISEETYDAVPLSTEVHNTPIIEKQYSPPLRFTSKLQSDEVKITSPIPRIELKPIVYSPIDEIEHSDLEETRILPHEMGAARLDISPDVVKNLFVKSIDLSDGEEYELQEMMLGSSSNGASSGSTDYLSVTETDSTISSGYKSIQTSPMHGVLHTTPETNSPNTKSYVTPSDINISLSKSHSREAPFSPRSIHASNFTDPLYVEDFTEITGHDNEHAAVFDRHYQNKSFIDYPEVKSRQNKHYNTLEDSEDLGSFSPISGQQLQQNQFVPESPTTKSQQRDSAYQTKEPSTEKSNSKATSSAPSPETTVTKSQGYSEFNGKSDERRIRSQLELAARKLEIIQRAMMDDRSIDDTDSDDYRPRKSLEMAMMRRRSRKLSKLPSYQHASSLEDVTEENGSGQGSQGSGEHTDNQEALFYLARDATVIISEELEQEEMV